MGSNAGSDRGLPQYLSTRELAERWNVSVKQVRELVHRGEIAHNEFGYRTWRFRLVDVVAYENDRRRQR